MDLYLLPKAISAVLAAFLVAFAHKRAAVPAVRLVFWLLCLTLGIYVAYPLTGDSLLVYAVSIGLVFLQGPAFWWLILSQVSGTKALFHWVHVIPVPVAFAATLLIGGEWGSVLIILASVSRLVYCGIGYRELWRNRHSLGAKNRLIWLGTFLLMACWVSFNNITGYTLYASADYETAGLYFKYFNTFVYGAVIVVLMWWALIRPEIYLEMNEAGMGAPPPETDFDRETFSALETAFAEQQLYRDEATSLASVADLLAVTPRELSNAINRCAGKSFRAYMREHRIAYVKELLADPEKGSLPVFEVAMEAGFGTKSTFNEAFKAETGMTPSLYRNQYLQ